VREFVVCCLVLTALALLAGCAQQAPPGGPGPAGTTPVTTTSGPAAETVKVISHPALGGILADSQGRTLYYYVKDIPGSGSSSCTGACLVRWPAFAVAEVTVPAALEQSDFRVITRPEGGTQITYRGWPLYYFTDDTQAENARGEGVGQVWYVMKPTYTVVVADSPVAGTYLTDARGRTLYFFTRDSPGSSTCTGTCLANWPAFSPASIGAPSVLSPGDFTSNTRTEGGTQAAYRGRPLYYYGGDTGPGQLKGQGLNGVWFAANPAGTVPEPVPVTTATSTMTVMTTTPVPTTTRPPYYY